MFAPRADRCRQLLWYMYYQQSAQKSNPLAEIMLNE
jgi:hypothetical protein